MSRAAVPGLPSRYPIGEQLPALYADDDFAQRFTAGLDTVLAPVFATLDNLPAYLDPRVTPADFLSWLATWVGGVDDPRWPLELRREAVARAVELHRWRGTRRGLVEALSLILGVYAEVSGDGGASWSATAGGAPAPAVADEVLVRVWAHREAVNADRVRALVRTLCPVHTVCRVEVVPGPPPAEANGGDGGA
ncbi:MULTISPECIES: phage tail protein [Streptomyces]|uniref:Secreted protein n=1 Tax=Streptomyces venezuelae (strain ATCC 10712 / CBS 650.69 / DSM 40230 / JCM 4526 / NBRC 13096 / PD 04745) TaxID=953739 RepID=F2RAQ4_STRVP|nr:phage tail protein [Streptomyces venezuelae]APE24646.1 phage tail protein [Streptomyces venezuelae]QES01999.1 phage tail protein [Streptomyces venezuelae ATCC 10712]QES08972.1 phage tail protein [Streptomyces venezuelae]QES12377.1 phage tail protein [Streptomyces venezuelae]CCA59123.1 secreted protein [Streptomyces venezuelae ATCC 10712]